MILLRTFGADPVCIDCIIVHVDTRENARVLSLNGSFKIDGVLGGRSEFFLRRRMNFYNCLAFGLNQSLYIFLSSEGSSSLRRELN